MKEGKTKSNVKKNNGETRKAPAPPSPRAKKEEELLHQRVKELEECLTRYVHLHSCEMEGLSSGQPTFAEWMEQHDKANQLLTKDKE